VLNQVVSTVLFSKSPACVNKFSGQVYSENALTQPLTFSNEEKVATLSLPNLQAKLSGEQQKEQHRAALW